MTREIAGTETTEKKRSTDARNEKKKQHPGQGQKVRVCVLMLTVEREQEIRVCTKSGKHLPKVRTYIK